MNEYFINMQFPNELFRYILKIRYYTWLEFRKCLCGKPDFKKCKFIRCGELFCKNVYCRIQKGLCYWMWECQVCELAFCGLHTSYNHTCRKCLLVDYKLYLTQNSIEEIKKLSSLKITNLSKMRIKIGSRFYDKDT